MLPRPLVSDPSRDRSTTDPRPGPGRGRDHLSGLGFGGEVAHRDVLEVAAEAVEWQWRIDQARRRERPCRSMTRVDGPASPRTWRRRRPRSPGSPRQRRRRPVAAPHPSSTRRRRPSHVGHLRRCAAQRGDSRASLGLPPQPGGELANAVRPSRDRPVNHELSRPYPKSRPSRATRSALDTAASRRRPNS